MPSPYRLAVSILNSLGIYEKRESKYAIILREFVEEKQLVLDVGCGSGRIADALACDRWVIGIDLNRRLLRKNAVKRFSPLLADAEHLPFRSGCFDSTLLISCIEHLDKPEASIQEINRTLQSTGNCIVQLPNLQWFLEPHTKFPFLTFMPQWLSTRIQKPNNYVDLNLEATLKNVLQWFRKHDFINTKRMGIQHVFWLPFSQGWFLTFEKAFQHHQPNRLAS